MIADANALKRLRSWLSREAHGSTEDLRSPFFSRRLATSKKLIHETRDSVVKRLWKEIGSIKVALPLHYQKLVFTVEQDQASNIGPQSPYLPWDEDGPDKVADVYCDKPKSKILNVRALELAIEHVQSLLPLGSIRMTSIEEAIGHERDNPHSVNEDGMDITTSSGLPHVKSPWKPRPSQTIDREESERAFSYIMERTKLLMTELRAGHPVEFWALQGKRLAQKGMDIKKRKRLIEALEKPEPIIWKTFTPELLAKLSEKVEFCALNDLPQIDRKMQEILQIAEDGGRTVIGGDYSGYDATLPPWLIQMAGDIVSRWVRGGETLISTLTSSMVNGVYLVTPNKIWYPQPSSMKSGSGGTNLLDSICNLIVIYYGQEIGAYKTVSACVQGDDFVLDAIGANPEAVAQVSSHFGLVAHPDKQMFEPHALQFLQRLHFKGFLGGMASVMRTLGSIMSYERLTVNPKLWGPIADIIRARAQLENTVFNPYFECLVNFVSSGDRYGLGGTASPGDLINTAGPAGLEVLQRMYGAPNKSISRGMTVQEMFNISAVAGVLRGEDVPPLGSDARFSFAYGERAA